jgi:hypothetical protein
MNTKTKQVEMRTSKHTEDAGSVLQKGADFLKAFTLGFDVDVLPPKNHTHFPSFFFYFGFWKLTDYRTQFPCYV